MFSNVRFRLYADRVITPFKPAYYIIDFPLSRNVETESLKKDGGPELPPEEIFIKKRLKGRSLFP
jgi:hypothetical protein